MKNHEAAILECVPGLRRYAYALCRSAVRIDADDLVQDCLMQAFRRFDQWKKGSNLRAWLFTIMHHQFINQLRKGKRESEGYLLDQVDHAIIEAENDCQLDELEQALDQLAPDQKSIILLITLEGLSYQQMAKILEIPEGTVMSRLSRARKRLRDILSQDGDSNVRYLK